MDPNATLIALLEAIEDRKYADANARLLDLFTWLRSGGFPPHTEAAIEAIRKLTPGV